MKFNKFINFSLIILIALPIGLEANTIVTHTTASDFNGGIKDRVQVKGTADAQLQLNFQWENIQVPSMLRQMRYYSQLAYDSDNKLVVMYGGQKDFSIIGGGLDDTYIFNIKTNVWQAGPGKLKQRSGHGLVYTKNNKVLLFGGYDQESVGYLGDAYLYDTQSSSWTQVYFSTAPSARGNFAMAKAGDKIVLFGGRLDIMALAHNTNETWVYDINATTWSLKPHIKADAPIPRKNCSMAYNSSNGLIYLYGGEDDANNSLSDLWSYSIQNDSWVYISAAGTPLMYDKAGFVYDQQNDVLFLYGDEASKKNSIFSFRVSSKTWSYNTPVNIIRSRRNHSMAYIPELGKSMLFGGSQVTADYSDIQAYFSYNSSGVYVSPAIDAYANAQAPPQVGVKWDSLAFDSILDSDLSLKYQLASSADNVDWSSFTDVYGNPAVLHNLPNGAITCPITTSIHNDKRYFKYKIFFNSTKIPKVPYINSVTVSYNITPEAPVLLSPLNGGSTNTVTPAFSWYDNTPIDSDPMAYRIQVANDPDFTSPIIDSAGIAQGPLKATSFKSNKTLSTGLWYWHISSTDTHLGSSWSQRFLVEVDTTAPNAITALSGQMGQVNGSAVLAWSFPGDDGSSGSIVNGSYQIRIATSPVTTEKKYLSLPLKNQRTGRVSQAGKTGVVTVTGLLDETTYYFSMKIADEAGNYSPIATVSPLVLTNAKPVVYLIYPAGGGFITRYSSILWNSYDPNYNDTRVFSLYVSTDFGKKYSLIVSSLTFGTTSYLWDSRAVENGINNKIQVKATDARGLSGETMSECFMVYNQTQNPVVEVLYPNGGEKLYRKSKLSWRVKDSVVPDTYNFNVYISSDSGSSYQKILTTQSTYYLFNTSTCPNGVAYRIKVTADDIWFPQFSGSAQSAADFYISNNNQQPNNFRLLTPLNGEEKMIFFVVLSWENNSDPNPEDTLYYTVYFSKNSDFTNSIIISSITGNSYHIDEKDLLRDTTYYWKVRAADPLGGYRECFENFKFYVLDRFRAKSFDDNVDVKITSSIPLGCYIKIDKIDSSQDSTIAFANNDTIADKHIKNTGYSAYKISVCDDNNNEIAVNEPKIILSMKYNDSNSDGYLDNSEVKTENLRVSMINRATGKWLSSPSFPADSVQAKKITSEFGSLGVFTMLAMITPDKTLSSVVNYPNPFNPKKQNTRIKYVLAENANVTLSIYTLIGDLVWVKEIKSGTEGGLGQPTGYTNEVLWDGSNSSGVTVATGMYLLEIKAGSNKYVRKIGVVKN